MSPPPKSSLAELIASLPEDQRTEVLSGLTDRQAEAALYDWRGIWARSNQVPPDGDWRYWLLLAGRGFGKTRTGAEAVREWAEKPLPAPIHLIAPTAADIRKVMIEGMSGLMACYPPGQRPVYEPSRGHRIVWPNGNVAFGFSADEPERLRGPQCCRFWADELAAWRFAEDAWDNLMFGFRIGDDLRGVVTTTPKPLKIIRELLKNPATAVTRASTYENRTNLAPGFFADIIRKYEGTRLGRQELLAEVLEDIPGALWTRASIDAGRIRLQDVRWDLVTRAVVAIDPAVTSNPDSDETGIVVAGLTRSEHVIILDDKSCKETPLGWATAAVNAWKYWGCDRIVGEVNNGGDLVEMNIRGIEPSIAFRKIHASRGKTKRAEPVAALYEQGRVHHVGFFEEMERQMCEYTPQSTDRSQHDDRMDALVYAVTELLIEGEEQSMTVRFNDPGSYQISPV
jgi:phage terminase large subunit-like protein